MRRPADGFVRGAVGRMVAAIARRDAHALVDAGTLIASALRCADPRTSWSSALAVLEATLIALPSHAPPELEYRLRHAADALVRRSAMPAGDVITSLEALWPEMAATLHADRAGTHDRAQLLDGHLAACIRSNATLGAIAKRLGYSPAHVSGMIRRTTGVPFVVLRRRMRLERARWLLGRGASVKEAALAAGFRDPAYFGRVFRRAHGTSPARWVKATSRPDQYR